MHAPYTAATHDLYRKQEHDIENYQQIWLCKDETAVDLY